MEILTPVVGFLEDEEADFHTVDFVKELTEEQYLAHLSLKE